MKIYLMGYMGSGKSTLGRLLAKRTGQDFVDFDDYLEEREGQTIREIFDESGELYFRKQEALYLSEILNGFPNTIVSLGGGTPCYGDNMSRIKEAEGKSVYINVPVEELTRRLWEQREKRPLLKHQDSREKLEEFVRKHLFERSFYYNQADEKIFVRDQSELRLVEDLEARLF